MTRTYGNLLFFFLFVCFAPSPSGFSEIERTLSGSFASFSSEENLIVLRFTHPATGKTERMDFTIGSQTGFSGFESVSDLEEGDRLQLDYRISAEGKRQILRLSKVQLSGPPEGLRNFDKKDLLRSENQ